MCHVGAVSPSSNFPHDWDAVPTPHSLHPFWCDSLQVSTLPIINSTFYIPDSLVSWLPVKAYFQMNTNKIIPCLCLDSWVWLTRVLSGKRGPRAVAAGCPGRRGLPSVINHSSTRNSSNAANVLFLFPLPPSHLPSSHLPLKMDIHIE